MRPAGTLAVVATPIGNLEDLTLRALRTLKEVDLIAAEDTRRTSRLLAHYGISKSLVSLHEHNEHREAPKLVRRMLAGESVALVSDAGTPGISDPGAGLVHLARASGLKVVPIPGPNAVVTALSVSGLTFDGFCFLGFPPASGSDRRRWFTRLFAEPGVVSFFEAPHRIARTLAEASEGLGERPIIVNREISKIHEEWAIYSNDNMNDRHVGEFVIIVGPATTTSALKTPSGISDAAELIGRMTNESGMAAADVLIALERFASIPRAHWSNALKKAMIAAKRRGHPD